MNSQLGMQLCSDTRFDSNQKTITVFESTSVAFDELMLVYYGQKVKRNTVYKKLNLGYVLLLNHRR